MIPSKLDRLRIVLAVPREMGPADVEELEDYLANLIGFCGVSHTEGPGYCSTGVEHVLTTFAHADITSERVERFLALNGYRAQVVERRRPTEAEYAEVADFFDGLPAFK